MFAIQEKTAFSCFLLLGLAFHAQYGVRFFHQYVGDIAGDLLLSLNDAVLYIHSRKYDKKIKLALKCVLGKWKKVSKS